MEKIKKNIISGFLAVFFSAVPSLATSISVTAVSVSENMATVEINSVIEIREIKITDNDIEVTDDVIFHTAEARKVVKNAVFSRTPSDETIKRINYKVTSLEPYDAEGSSLAGFASVTFNGELEIKCRIFESRYNEGEYWVNWPARSPDEEAGESEWKDQVLIVNTRVKEIVEQAVLDRFTEDDFTVDTTPQVDVEVTQSEIYTPLTVTSVNINKVNGRGGMVGSGIVVLNHAVKISDIELYERLGQTFIELPLQQYRDVEIYSSDLRNAIKEALSSENASENTSNKIGFQLQRSRMEKIPTDTPMYKCSVTVNEALGMNLTVIDGATYDAFVSWPSVREDGEYVDKVQAVNSDVKKAIEEAVLTKYRKEN